MLQDIEATKHARRRHHPRVRRPPRGRADRADRAALPRPGLRADRARGPGRDRDARARARRRRSRGERLVHPQAPGRHRGQPVLHQGDAAQPGRGDRRRVGVRGRDARPRAGPRGHPGADRDAARAPRRDRLAGAHARLGGRPRVPPGGAGGADRRAGRADHLARWRRPTRPASCARWPTTPTASCSPTRWCARRSTSRSRASPPRAPAPPDRAGAGGPRAARHPRRARPPLRREPPPGPRGQGRRLLRAGGDRGVAGAAPTRRPRPTTRPRWSACTTTRRAAASC